VRGTEDRRLKLKIKQYDNDFGKKSQPYHTLDDMFAARQQLFEATKKEKSIRTRYVVSAQNQNRKRGLIDAAETWGQTQAEQQALGSSSSDMIRTDGFRNFRPKSNSPAGKYSKYRTTFLQVDDMETDFGAAFRIKDTLLEKEFKSKRSRRKEPDILDGSEFIPFPKTYAELEENRKERADVIKKWESTVPTKRDFYIKQVARIAHEETTKQKCESQKPKGFFAKKQKMAPAGDNVMLL
jgi:hypothetical protein